MKKEITFGERLKDLRKTRKLSQAELAKMLNIKQANISRYETGLHMPEAETLIEIAELFDVGLDTLVFSDGFTKEELEFVRDSKKISIEELKDKYELVVDDIPATDQEIEDAIKFIKFNRTQN